MVARLSLASHTLAIERNRGGAFTPLAAGGSVLPEEAVRYSAHIPPPGGWADFEVLDAGGRTVWGPSTARSNLAGNAWEDAQAPRSPGTYTLLGAARKGFRYAPAHELRRTFQVDPGAPAPPGGGGFEWPDIAGLFGARNAWTIVIILGAVIALGILL